MQVHRPGRSAARHGHRRGGAEQGGRRLAALSGAVVLVAAVSLPAAASSSGGVPAKAVSGLSVGVSPLYPGAQADYFVDFKATAGVAAGGDVYLSETTGPTGFSTETTVQVQDVTQGWQFLASGVRFGPGVSTRPLGLRDAGLNAEGAMELPLKDAIKAGDHISVTVEGATNPQGGKVSDFGVYTTGNPTAGLAPSYRVLSLAEALGTGCTLPPGQTCYSVQAFRNAYGISPLLARGIDGRGRTVVLVEWPPPAPPGMLGPTSSRTWLSSTAISTSPPSNSRWCRGRHPRPLRTWP